MGTIADKLAYLAGTKTAIKSAIENKGVDVGGIPFRQYADKIDLISGGAVEPEPYVRPSDWLELPAVNEGDQKVGGLHAVFPHDSNFVAFKCSGAYTVDWGDNTTDSYSSGATASHIFNYSDFNTDCSRGYRQAIITITPQSGQNLIELDFAKSHPSYTFEDWQCTGWLDIKIAGEYIERITFVDEDWMIAYAGMLEIFEFIGKNNIEDFSLMFADCGSLQSIPQLDTSSGTDFSYMFADCCSLQSIPQLDTSKGIDFNSMFGGCCSLQSIPQLDTSNGTDFGDMFYECYSLQSIPQLDTSNGTNFEGMFIRCYSLQSIPQLDTSKGIDFNSMFGGCYSLQSIPQLDTSSGTNFVDMFGGCSSLQSIPLLDTSSGTDFSDMFSFCYSLQSIPLLDTSSGTDFSDMFSFCYSLQSIPLLDTSSGTDFNGMFYYCSSLSSAPLQGTPQNISYENCRLSRQALIDIFNGLATVQNKTITITGNYGASQLTANDKNIATNKGWTITG